MAPRFSKPLMKMLSTWVWARKWKPTPVFLPGKSHGQRDLAGYSPQGCRELETTKQLNNKTRYNGFHPMSSLHDTSEDILQKDLKSQMGRLWINQKRDCCGWVRLKDGVFKKTSWKESWGVSNSLAGLEEVGCHVVSGPVDRPRWLWPDRKPPVGRNREGFTQPHGNDLGHNQWAGKMAWASDKNERKTNVLH